MGEHIEDRRHCALLLLLLRVRTALELRSVLLGNLPAKGTRSCLEYLLNRDQIEDRHRLPLRKLRVEDVLHLRSDSVLENRRLDLDLLDQIDLLLLARKR